MAQKLRKHGKNWKKTSVGCDIDFTILLSMLKVKTTKLLTSSIQAIHIKTICIITPSLVLLVVLTPTFHVITIATVSRDIVTIATVTCSVITLTIDAISVIA